ncbi:MAG: cyclic lactone autoinducer peptide [Bacilli bacterium]|jgi:cyclic lactone autoinducer peptide
MKRLYALALVAMGLLAANAASTACFWLLIDEPEMPESLVK